MVWWRKEHLCGGSDLVPALQRPLSLLQHETFMFLWSLNVSLSDLQPLDDLPAVRLLHKRNQMMSECVYHSGHSLFHRLIKTHSTDGELNNHLEISTDSQAVRWISEENRWWWQVVLICVRCFYSIIAG